MFINCKNVIEAFTWMSPLTQECYNAFLNPYTAGS